MGVLLCGDNYLDEGVLSAQTYSTQETNFPATNLTQEKRRSKVWRSTAISDQWIKWDLGIASSPKAFFAIGRGNVPLNISSTATIKLQGNETDTWATPSYDQTLTYNDNILMAIDTDGLHTSALRWWRLSIDDDDNLDGYIELANCYLGDAFVPAQGSVQFPLDIDYVDYSTTIYSINGSSFSDPRPKAEMYSFDWNYLTYADKEAIDEIFDTVQTYNPIFVAFDPTATYSSVANYYAKYVKFESPPRASYYLANIFSYSMSLREEI